MGLPLITAPVLFKGIWKICKLIGKGVVDHFERKDELKDAKHKAEVSRIARIDEQQGEIDLISVQNRGWKDEYLLLLTTIPFIGVFFPTIRPWVADGFLAMQTTIPEYYWYALAAVYIDALGFRQLCRAGIETFIGMRIKKYKNGD